MNLQTAAENVGRSVIYRSGPTLDLGVIVRVGERLVFVRYEGDSAAKATYAEDLELASGGAA